MAVPTWSPGTVYITGELVQPLTQQVAAINQPDDPGFESGTLADWSQTPTGGSATGSVQNQYVDSGTYAFYWPGGSGSGNEGGIECELVNDERVNVTAGTTSITASCRIMYNPASSPNGSQGRVRIYWFDGGGVQIGSPSDGNLIKGRGNNGRWVTSTVTATAPVGAVTAAIGAWLTTVSGGTFADTFQWNYVQELLPGLIYRAVQPNPGISDNEEPVWPQVLGVQVVDNTVIWEAVQANRVTWQASPIMESGMIEPAFPTVVGERVTDNNITWEAVSRRIEDENCPNSKEVTVVASHVFATDDDIVRFCAAANAKDWTTSRNAGYLATGLQQANASGMKVLNQYRSNVVCFNASVFQNWQADPDPALMTLLDQLPGIGSQWQQAAQPVSNDLFFLSPLGVRSVGIAGATTHLQAGDVGMPVDPMIQPALAAALSSGKQPRGTFYPGAGQYWLSFGEYPPSVLTIAGDFPDLWGTNAPADFSYTSAGGVSPKVFSITGGSLPPGFSLLASGAIVGSSSVVGSYAWEVTVTDLMGETASLSDGTVIAAGPQISGDPPDGTIGIAYPAFGFGSTGGTLPVVFSLVAGAFPPGLTLNADGTVTGTPTGSGTYTPTVRVTDANLLFTESTHSVAVLTPVYASRGSLIYVSPDVVTWSLGSNISSHGLPDVGYIGLHNGLLFAFRSNGSAGAVSNNYGAPGSWTPIVGIVSASGVNSMVWTGIEWLIFMQSGQCYVTVDGINVTQRVAFPPGNALGSCIRGDTVCVTKNLFGAKNMRVSGDKGVNYALVYLNFMGSTNLVVDTGNVFAAFGSAAGMGTSPTGAAWVQKTNYPFSNTIGAAYMENLGRLVAVNSAGDVSYSDDEGDTWSAPVNVFPMTYITSSMLMYRRGYLIMAGVGGEIGTSPDAINWTTQIVLPGQPEAIT